MSRGHVGGSHLYRAGQPYAEGFVTLSGGAITASVLRGCTATWSAAGIHLIDTTAPVTAGTAQALVTIQDDLANLAAGSEIHIGIHQSTTTRWIVTSTDVAGNPADCSFSFAIKRLS